MKAKTKGAKKKRLSKNRAAPKTVTKKGAGRSSKHKKSPAMKSGRKLRKGGVRSYSLATIKELFGLCSNECAFPACTNEIIAAATKLSKAAVAGHVCHIYAASNKGPRGKPSLTEKERNSPGNLLLFCGHHHSIVDKQWKTYPATLLKEWKRAHEAKATKGTAEAIKREADIEKHVFFEAMSDQQIEKGLARIRRGRYLTGFLVADEAQTFARQVEQSRYSSGSPETRARALAWCAQILSQSDTPRAKELLRKSGELARTPEAMLAQAFITAATEPGEALGALAKMKTPASLSAALRIVAIRDGPKKTLSWVNASGLSVDHFDAEGKFTFMMNALADGEWAIARKSADSVTEQDFEECPSILHAVAMARLLTCIPDELKPVALT